MTPSVVISRRGADRVRAGHPWIYQSDILEAEAESGDLVRVREERRRGLGWGLWSSQSQIALRMMLWVRRVRRVRQVRRFRKR